MRISISILIVLALVASAWAYPDGAPIAACGSMIPLHNVQPQESEMPYDVTVSSNKLSSGETTKISIMGKGSQTFRGFLIEVRSGTKPVGTFSTDDTLDARTLDCPDGTANAATHTNRKDKSVVTVNWTANQGATGELIVTVSVIHTKKQFWTAQKTQIITVANG